MSYYFGVEIEAIAEPRDVQYPLLWRVYYEKLARSLIWHGLSAIADRLDGSRYCKHAEFYNSHWWITKDGSLKEPSYPSIPLEVVSPILWTGAPWKRQIDVFWMAWGNVFQTPDASSLCGSHIHISPWPRGAFSLPQLKDIAIGVIFWEPLVHELLLECRKSNKYCRRNTLRSVKLRNMGSYYEDEMREVCRYVREEVEDAQELRDFMQENTGKREDRYVLWNFDNILPGKSGSIEFRGGHGLRGSLETRKWIAFVVAFIHLCIERVSLPSSPVVNGGMGIVLIAQVQRCDNQETIENCSFSRSLNHYSMKRFWSHLSEAARFLDVWEHLPLEYFDLADQHSQNCSEEDGDYNDDSSVVSKGDFTFSDSEF